MAFSICMVAIVLTLLLAQLGSRTMASVALARMLIAFFALVVSLRYWFVVSHWVSEREELSPPLVFVIVFWAIYLVVAFAFSKLCDTYAENYESVLPSFIGRVLGGLCGLVGGAIVVASLMMTLTIATREFFPAYDAKTLPWPIDRAPLLTYRFIEQNLARVKETDAGHTLLPVLRDADPNQPEKFWR